MSQDQERDAAERPGDRLRQHRRGANISADLVAPLIGLTPTTLRAKERDERPWHPSQVQAYLRAIEAIQTQRLDEASKRANELVDLV